MGGVVERPLRLALVDLGSMPQAKVRADFHCVTGWTRLDMAWEGVPFHALADRAGAKPEARFVRFTDGARYDTTLPLPTALRGEVLLATRAEGKPLAPDHGGPLRLLAPGLYGWKSVKWLRTIDFLAEDRLGFWEARGYGNAADPWREERPG